MRLVALKPLPNGIPAGATFTENEIVGRLLIQAGVAREADPSAAKRITRRRANDTASD